MNMPKDPPNILLIVTDQQQAGGMSCAGNPDVNTPVLDNLAEQGVRFDNAYCTNPLCSPSRASMFTGRMPHEIGTMVNGREINPKFRSLELGNLFKQAGYDCAYGGKWHVPQLSITEEHGFEKICGFDDLRLPGACHEFLEKPRNNPFLLVACFDNPHNINEHGRTDPLPWGAIDSAPQNEWPNLPPNFKSGPFEPEMVTLFASNNPRIQRRIAFSEEDWRFYRYGYFRLIEKVDQQIGQILSSLRTLNLEENTIVVFTSDHGEMAGSHELSNKMVLYEESIKVPFIIKTPQAQKPGRINDNLVSTGLDLLPTLCDFANIPAPDGLPGKSLAPFLLNEYPDNWRDQLVIQSQFVDQSYGINGRALIKDQYKYAVYSDGQNREQVFDLKKDPYEQVNLAKESRYSEILNNYRQTLYQWLVANKDLFGQHYSHPGQPSLPNIPFSEVGLREWYIS
jgi:arylsulfatase A-like enzyme